MASFKVEHIKRQHTVKQNKVGGFMTKNVPGSEAVRSSEHLLTTMRNIYLRVWKLLRLRSPHGLKQGNISHAVCATTNGLHMISVVTLDTTYFMIT